MSAKGYIMDPPELAHVKDVRMGDLNPSQLDNARELWLGHRLGWMPAYHMEFYLMLLRRIDALRNPVEPL